MFVASINPSILIPVAVFIGISALVWFLFDLFNRTTGRAEERLDMLSDPRRKADRENDARDSKKKEALARVLEKASPALSKPLTPKTEAEMSVLKQRLVEAGFRSESAPAVFLSFKVICGIAFLFVSGALFSLLAGMNTNSLIKAAILGGAGFYIPELALTFLGMKRRKAIFQGLPDALDLLVVCVEAGLGLDQALRKVAEEMKKSYRILSDEISLANLHLQMGRARNQVLQDLGARTGVDDLRSLASLLIQADKFGSSVANALRVQSDSMRTRRQQIAEEKAAKTAVKLIFPLVIFIFPGVFVVLVGPAAIQMVREMFPAMNR
ncbi:MAG: type II secretion system F family protein [Pirellulales bacterium]